MGSSLRNLLWRSGILVMAVLLGSACASPAFAGKKGSRLQELFERSVRRSDDVAAQTTRQSRAATQRSFDNFSKKFNRPSVGGPNTGTTQRFNEAAYNTDNTVRKARASATSLQDEMVLEAAQRGHGKELDLVLGDTRYKGMRKVSYGETSATGARSEVHYVRNPWTGNTMNHKFVSTSKGGSVKPDSKKH